MAQFAHPPVAARLRGFTLVEALVAISITALAGSVLLLGTTSSLQSTEEALRQTIALGIAQQMINEAAGASSIAEIQGFNGYRSQPPTDRWGVPLGADNGKGGQRHANLRATAALLEHYLVEVHVHPVAVTDFAHYLPAGTASAYRVVDVRVSYNPPGAAARELARLRRVVTHQPPYEPIQ